MTLAVMAAKVKGLSGDGLSEFNCPKCGKVITRYHPYTKGQLELKCPRTGAIGPGQGICGWKDYVYFNVEPEEWARAAV